MKFFSSFLFQRSHSQPVSSSSRESGPETVQTGQTEDQVSLESLLSCSSLFWTKYVCGVIIMVNYNFVYIAEFMGWMQQNTKIRKILISKMITIIKATKACNLALF